MHLYVSKKAILQYLMLYVMLIFCQTHVYRLYIRPNLTVHVGLAILFLIIGAVNFRKKMKRPFWMCAFLLAAVFFVRFINGGVGIVFWVEMAAKILITYIAILIDPEQFLTRFVKIITFFAAISIVGWLQQIAGLNIMQKIGMVNNDFYTTVTWDKGYVEETQRKIYGLLFYVTTEFEIKRNMSIFTEPGIYQMVLNAAIFVVVFCNKLIELNRKEIKKIYLILTIALITTQSTSGYFGYAVIVLGVLLTRSADTRTIKNYIYIILMVGLVVLLGDYSVRGNDSLIYKALLSKVFSSQGDFSLSASTGVYRYEMIAMAILAMAMNPFGMGYEAWEKLYRLNSFADAGGYPFIIGAVIGIVPLLVSLWWIFSPLKYMKNKWVEIVVFVFLYFNTAMAQTSAFYPAIIFLPVFLDIMRQNINDLELEKEVAYEL